MARIRSKEERTMYGDPFKKYIKRVQKGKVGKQKSKDTMLREKENDNKEEKISDRSCLSWLVVKDDHRACAQVFANADLSGIIRDFHKRCRNDRDIREAVKAWLKCPKTAEAMYGHISDWDTSKVTNMHALFRDCASFNENISSWDTSHVVDMGAMFSGAYTFNCDLRRWNTSSVVNMEDMFKEASDFNCDLSKWDTSKVKKMFNMFYNAESFDADISSWDLSSVKGIARFLTRQGVVSYDFE